MAYLTNPTLGPGRRLKGVTQRELAYEVRVVVGLSVALRRPLAVVQLNRSGLSVPDCGSSGRTGGRMPSLTAWWFGSYTGLRCGEMAALRVRDVDPLRRRMLIAR
jgi:hypothetical protein